MSSNTIKCVVWDLDNTIWDGTLSEGDKVTLREGVFSVIKTLDERGILQSISSKNEFEVAAKKLKELGLWAYFIYPQINWDSKSVALEKIAKSINININTFAFVDDQEFEREEVNFSHPEVMCIDAKDIRKIPKMERMIPKYITDDSKNRRIMYQNDIERNKLESSFEGTKEEFLATLNLRMKIELGQEVDLQRMEELTVRTHQLNSTGTTYSYNELKDMIYSNNYIVLVASLNDKFGIYGKIGLSVIEKKENLWEIKLLLMSCRVMSKGVGNVMLNHIVNLARGKNVKLYAEFVPTDSNRIMYITYKLNGFKECGQEGILEADTSYERKMPYYVCLN